MDLQQAFREAVTGVYTMLQLEALGVLGVTVVVWWVRAWHARQTW